MRALIDCDIFQWEFGSGTDSEGKLEPWPFIQARVQSRIEGILEAVDASDYQLYLTSDDKSNFRYKIATILPYKGNRQGTEKPHYYQHIRNFLKDHRGAIEVHGIEADDAMSIEQWRDYRLQKSMYSAYTEDNPIEEGHLGDLDTSLSEWQCNTVICSRDKDLHMVPGYHYSWGCGKQKEKEMWYVDELTGLKSFYKQLLTGDSTDNIPGLYGVGKSSSYLRAIDNCESELDCYKLVRDLYEKRFGNYCDQFLLENARLLWMLSYEGEEWIPPTERGEK